MNELFVHQLQDIYYAEKQLVKALPKMAAKATDKQLKQGFVRPISMKPKRMCPGWSRYLRGMVAPK